MIKSLINKCKPKRKCFSGASEDMEFSSINYERYTKLAREGYIINESGVTTCTFCRTYCGQCSDGCRHGLTMDEYEERFWK